MKSYKFLVIRGLVCQQIEVSCKQQCINKTRYHNGVQKNQEIQGNQYNLRCSSPRVAFPSCPHMSSLFRKQTQPSRGHIVRQTLSGLLKIFSLTVKFKQTLVFALGRTRTLNSCFPFQSSTGYRRPNIQHKQNQNGVNQL